jgi:glycosyltransferase involved in cell wall biosynthesis
MVKKNKKNIIVEDTSNKNIIKYQKVKKPKTICLNMIVKNEAHIILETLNNLVKYIDYWVISDTGSTDGTQELIKKFFADANIPGELIEHEWKNFGHNRTMALECAYNKSDYVLIMDADDIIQGDILFPKLMTADSYTFKFGTSFIYYRALLLSNRLKWVYKGVLHEFSKCIDKENIQTARIPDSCYIESRRLGDRSKDPEKYLKDANILIKAIEDNEEPDLAARYCFYVGQSYRDYNDLENAIIWYKKRIGYGGWFEEVYISFLEAGLAMIHLNYPSEEIITTFMNGFRVLPNRVECLFFIAQYYFENKRMVEAYNVISIAYKIPFPHQYLLFLKKDIYDFRVKQLRYFIMIFMYLNRIEAKHITRTKLFDEITVQKKIMLLDPLVPELVKQSLNFKLELEINDKTYTDYTYYKSLDSPGNDISYFPNTPIDELKKISDGMEEAVGFNTYGYIKFKISKESEFKFLENKNYNFDGLYVKNK